MEMNMKEIGKEIRTFRKANRLTQRDIADQLGVSTTQVSLFERGAAYPKPEQLQILSEFTGISFGSELESERTAEVLEVAAPATVAAATVLKEEPSRESSKAASCIPFHSVTRNWNNIYKERAAEAFCRGADFTDVFNPYTVLMPRANSYDGMIVGPDIPCCTPDGTELYVQSMYIPANGYRKWIHKVYPDAIIQEGEITRTMHENRVYLETTVNMYKTPEDSHPATGRGISEVKILPEKRVDYETCVAYAKANAIKNLAKNLFIGIDLNWQDPAVQLALDTFVAFKREDGQTNFAPYYGPVLNMQTKEILREAVREDWEEQYQKVCESKSGTIGSVISAGAEPDNFLETNAPKIAPEKTVDADETSIERPRNFRSAIQEHNRRIAGN